MEDREYLNNYFKQAGEYRDSVPDSAVGLIQKSYEIFIDIPDEPGTIATTTTLLALNHVSIKNIGIIHNREFEEGVLKISQESHLHLQSYGNRFLYQIRRISKNYCKKHRII